jgi:predicted HTH transcriptional regulator
LFGVSPDGTIVGVEPGNRDTAQLSLIQHLRDKLDPQIPISVELVDMEGKVVVALSSKRPPSVPIVEYGGRAFIREGSSTRVLSLQERASLLRRRNRDNHPGPWRCDRCGTVAGMLASIAVTDRGVERSYNCGCGGEWWPA